MWSSVSLVTLDYFSSQSTPLLYGHMYELIWLWWVVLHVFQLLCHLFCFNYCAKWAFNNSQLETEIFKVCSSPPKECALNSQHQHIMARAHSTVFSNQFQSINSPILCQFLFPFNYAGSSLPACKYCILIWQNYQQSCAYCPVFFLLTEKQPVQDMLFIQTLLFLWFTLSTSADKIFIYENENQHL